MTKIDVSNALTGAPLRDLAVILGSFYSPFRRRIKGAKDDGQVTERCSCERIAHVDFRHTRYRPGDIARLSVQRSLVGVAQRSTRRVPGRGRSGDLSGDP